MSFAKFISKTNPAVVVVSSTASATVRRSLCATSGTAPRNMAFLVKKNDPSSSSSGCECGSSGSATCN